MVSAELTMCWTHSLVGLLSYVALCRTFSLENWKQPRGLRHVRFLHSLLYACFVFEYP
jgi:hypothetical protein